MIIAIDPGDVQSAFVVMDGKFNIVDKGLEDNYTMKAYLEQEGAPYDKLIIEGVASYGMPVGRTVFETCIWIGRFIEAWGGDFELMYRKDVKMTLCGSMRAKDSNVRQALIDRFGAVGTKKKPGKLYGVSKDIWSALAVAVCYLSSFKSV